MMAGMLLPGLKRLTRSGRIRWLDRHLSNHANVRIYVSPDCDHDRHRIQLSSGTRVANEDEISMWGYDPSARLPLEPWQSPTYLERQLLFSKAVPRSMAESVSLLQLP